jgi:hypothetical protein
MYNFIYSEVTIKPFGISLVLAIFTEIDTTNIYPKILLEHEVETSFQSSVLKL